MSTPIAPIPFSVENLLGQGLYLFAGAPKIGKSWLSLDICLSVAKGETVLGQRTAKGTALYLCLEDNKVRLQNRLYELTNEPTDSLYFSLLADTIGDGLEQQIEQFYLAHRDLKIVVIDTLQKIRSSEESAFEMHLQNQKALFDQVENECRRIQKSTAEQTSNSLTSLISQSEKLSLQAGKLNEEFSSQRKELEEWKHKTQLKMLRWVVISQSVLLMLSLALQMWLR